MSRRADILTEIARRVGTASGIDEVHVGRTVQYGQDDPKGIAVILAGPDENLAQSQTLSRYLQVAVGVTYIIPENRRADGEEWYAFNELLATVVAAVELDPDGTTMIEHQTYRRLPIEGKPRLLTAPLERLEVDPFDIDGGETSLGTLINYGCRYQVPFGEL